jgi:hypothetical protein
LGAKWKNGSEASGYEEMLSAIEQIGLTKTVKRICMLLMDIWFFT